MTCLFWFTIDYSWSLLFLMQHVHLGPSKHLKGTSNVSSVPSTAAPPMRVQPTVCAAVDTTMQTLTLYRCPVPVCHSLMLFYVIYGGFDSLFWKSVRLWCGPHKHLVSFDYLQRIFSVQMVRNKDAWCSILVMVIGWY